MDEAKPKLRESFEVEHLDGVRETIIIRRLLNMEVMDWIDSGFKKSFLIFRSFERAEKGKHVDQEWYDDLTQDTAFDAFEKAMALNWSPAIQKKILQPTLAMLQSFASATPSNSLSAAEPTSPD